MTRRLSVLLALLALAAVPFRDVGAQPVPLVHEPRSPDGEGREIGRDLARIITDALPGVVELAAMPAARANALMDKHVPLCIVLHARSPARESTRRWVAELSRSRTFLVTSGPDDGEPPPGSVAVALAGTPYERMARDLGLAVEPVRTREQIFQMVRARRAVYWVEDARVLEQARLAGEIGAYRVVRELAPLSGWLACSLGVPESVVVQLAVKVEEMRADGSLQQVLETGGQADMPHSDEDSGSEVLPKEFVAALQRF